jgi:hypothetical protein
MRLRRVPAQPGLLAAVQANSNRIIWVEIVGRT